MPHRANGSYVSNSDALTAWTSIAREKLLETARSYHAVLTDEQLAAAVQQQSGIIHDDHPSSWIGKLLDRVEVETQRRDEPPLSALCVYDTDDALKAERRLLCYRAYAVDLPADGGVAVRVARPATRPTMRPAARREARPRATTASRPRASSAVHASDPPRRQETTCTSCFLIVPVGPTCSSCGAPLGT